MQQALDLFSYPKLQIIPNPGSANPFASDNVRAFFPAYREELDNLPHIPMLRLFSSVVTVFDCWNINIHDDYEIFFVNI